MSKVTRNPAVAETADRTELEIFGAKNNTLCPKKEAKFSLNNFHKCRRSFVA